MGWRDEIAKAVMQAAKPAPVAPIRAFHSSPYTFEKFDASKIGTGQGAASYGVGHYLAENPKVSGQGGEYWKEFLGKFMDKPEGEAARELMHSSFNRENAIDVLRRDLRGREFMGDTPRYAQTQEALRLLESGKPVGPRTYEVDIHARPEQFLDWDKPLVQQPQAVQEYANRIKVKPYRAQDPLPGSEIYQAGRRISNSGLYDVTPHEALREAGIPGIRYLDQGSRQNAAGIVSAENALRNNARIKYDDPSAWLAELARLKQAPQTFNYMVFPGMENILDIRKVYGLGGAIPTMGALADPSLYGAEANAQ